jgi:hypothetical protein
MKLLILLLVIACGKSGGSSSGGSSVTPSASVSAGSIYRVPVAISYTSTIGVKYDYSCDDSECEVSGEVIQFYLSATDMVYLSIEGTLNKVSGGYYGQVNYNQPPYVGSFGLFVNDDFTFKSLDDGARCAQFSDAASETSYDNLKASMNNLDLFTVDISGYQAKAACGL